MHFQNVELAGGENVLFIKNRFCYPNHMNVGALDRHTLGASFELYSMLLEQVKAIKKFKRIHLSNRYLAEVFS